MGLMCSQLGHGCTHWCTCNSVCIKLTLEVLAKQQVAGSSDDMKGYQA